MINIHLARSVPDAVVEKIQEHLDWEIWHNPNYSGAEFHILRDDYTYISNAADEIAAGMLMIEINHIIDPADEIGIGESHETLPTQ